MIKRPSKRVEKKRIVRVAVQRKVIPRKVSQTYFKDGVDAKHYSFGTARIWTYMDRKDVKEGMKAFTFHNRHLVLKDGSGVNPI